MSSALRSLALILAAGAAGWAARALVHRKTPPPEGRWQEISLRDGLKE